MKLLVRTLAWDNGRRGGAVTSLNPSGTAVQSEYSIWRNLHPNIKVNPLTNIDHENYNQHRKEDNTNLAPCSAPQIPVQYNDLVPLICTFYNTIILGVKFFI